MNVSKLLFAFKHDKEERQKIILAFLAIALVVCLLLVYLIPEKESESTSSTYQATEQEEKLSLLLKEIDGMGKVEAYITYNNDKATSCILLLEYDSITNRLYALRVAANYLNISQNKVSVYKLSN